MGQVGNTASATIPSNLFKVNYAKTSFFAVFLFLSLLGICHCIFFSQIRSKLKYSYLATKSMWFKICYIVLADYISITYYFSVNLTLEKINFE